MKAFYQKGVALVTVMLTVALISIIATEMTARLQLQMQRVSNVSFNQQAYWYAIGSEAFARRLLAEIMREEPDVTHLSQAWAQGENTFPVEGGEITGEITDLQSCFNLNALLVSSANNNTSNKKSSPRKAFEELIIALNIEGVDSFTAESMADALHDWLDADSSISSTGGAEDNDYSAKNFPYLAANYYLASVNELRVIEHFTVPVIEKLKDYVCVLPNTNMHLINVNTIDRAKPELLMAMLGISKNEASDILSKRDDEGFDDIADFFDLNQVSKLKLANDIRSQFTVKSQYFKLKTTTSFNKSYFTMRSILKSDDKNNINVISRKIGTE